ncbi:MAG: hypothetical protein IJ650_04990 [Paludibacteraceae bacterium]|nr:hypothetical protein [Paludibacteraceae bacterium]
MKKLYLLLPVLMFLFMPTVKAQQIVLQESFESAGIPATWSQEYVNGEQQWQVETLAEYAYPSGKIPDSKAGGGGSYRAYLRNTTGQTIGYTTRLITPAMDLTGVYRPILRFYHAQDKWTADVDTLRVYYRTDPEEDWLLLSDVQTGKKAEYTQAMPRWTAEQYELPNFNHKSYQIAFEGSDNMGRGIVLDSIVVRSYPECTLPYDITLTGVANGQATIGWHASWDADQFHIILTTVQVEGSDPALADPSVIVLDTLMDYDGIFSLTATGLKENTQYWVYLQSICAGQISEWSQPQTFTMAFREEIPYTETFAMTDMSFNPNDPKTMQLESWTWGGATPPVVGLSVTSQYYGIYSRVLDPAVMFNGSYSESPVYGRFRSAIPAHTLAWIATPELTGEDLKDCQVRFWATMAQRHSRKQANSIIVAAGADANDYTTFMPLDTITIETKDSIEEYIVSLEKYTGNGKFVAFISNFDKPNQFYIDEVTIEKRPAMAKPDYHTFHFVPATTSVEMTWAAPSAGVQSYNILVAKSIKIKNGQPVYTDKIIETSSTTPSATLSGLQSWTKNGYFVSIQAAYGNGVSEWSEPRKFFTSAAMTLPMHFGFEDSEGYYNIGDVAEYLYPNNIMVYSTDADWPRNTAATASAPAKEGEKTLYMSMQAGKNVWVVFPMVADVAHSQINFYLSSQTAVNKPRCMVEVGVMTEPSDINTFVKTAEFKAGEKWTRCYSNFIDYKGAGKFIAIRWMEPEGQNFSTNYIDDVTIANLVECPIPSGLSYTATDTTAVISWNKGIADTWNVKVNSTPFEDVDLTPETTVVGDMFNGQVTQPSATVQGLTYATSYYVYVQAVCDGGLTEWTSAYVIRTDCPSFINIPYAENFNGAREGGVNSSLHPSCWSWGGSEYQYLDGAYDSDNQGPNKGCLNIRTNSLTEIGWAVMPAFNIPVKDIMVEFDYRSAALVNSALYIGVMTDPNDFSTFEVVDSIIPQVANTWFKDQIVKFFDYNGNGQYIAFTCGKLRGNASYMQGYIDNVRVISVECQAPDIFVNSVASTELKFSWKGKFAAGSDGWQYVVATRELTTEELTDPNTIPPEVLTTKVVTTADSAVVTGLQKQTMYYIYVHALCGDSVWSTVTVMTECATIPAKSLYIEDFEACGPTVTATLVSGTSSVSYYKNAKLPECWTVGTYLDATTGYDVNPSAAGNQTIRMYYPYIVTNGRANYIASQYNDKGTALTTFHYSNSGVNSLYFRSTSGHIPSWAAMPKIDADSDEDFRAIVVKGSFKMATTATHRLIVGVMEDPTDINTFTVLDSIGPGTGTSANNDIHFEVPLENYTGNGRYIAFRTPYGVTGVQIYLDDIIIDGTGCYSPQSTLSRITNNSVRLTAGLQGESDWIYLLTDKAVSDDMLASQGGNPVVVEVGGVKVLSADNTIHVIDSDTLPYSSRFKTLAGLQASTKYYLSVAAACDLQNGLISQWSHYEFNTLCSPVTDFAEDFNSYTSGSGNAVGCWIVGNTNSSSDTYIPYVNTNSSYTIDGSKYLYFYTTPSNQAAYAISPILDVEDIRTKQLLFYASSGTGTNTAHQLKVGLVTDPLDLSTIVIIDTFTVAAKAGKYLVPFSKYEGDLNGNMGKHIIFYSECTMNNYIGIDNIQLQDIPPCAIPGKLTVEAVDHQSASLSWVGNNEKYRVVVTTKEVADTILNKGGQIANLVIDTIVPDAHCLISGLKHTTYYYFHVAGICGSDTTDFDFAGKQFLTECPPVMPLPYFTDFEGMPTGKRPFCWLGNFTDMTISFPYVFNASNSAYSGTNVIYTSDDAYAGNAILVSPLLDVDDLGKVQISFYARATKGGNLNIGIVPEEIVAQGESNDLNDNFVTLATITPGSAYRKYTIYFDEFDPALLAGIKHIAIKTDNSSYGFYIDDMDIRLIPTCKAPEGDDVWAEKSTLHTIDLHFLPASETDNLWEVASWDSEAANPDTIYQIVDTFDCVITNLPSSVIYNISVRTVCSATDKSDWSKPIKMNTQYEVDTYKWTFSGGEHVVLIEGTTSSYIHPALIGGSNNKSTTTATNVYRRLNTKTDRIYGISPVYDEVDPDNTDGALCMTTTSTVDTAFVILPIINNSSEKQLTFDVRGGSAWCPTHSNYPNMLGGLTAIEPYAAGMSIVVGTFDEGAGLESFQKLYEMRTPDRLCITSNFKDAEVGSAENNYMFEHNTVPLPSLEGKRAVILAVFSRAKGSPSTDYAYIDNLTIEPKTQVSTPQIKSTAVTDNSITVNWESNGSAAWDVLVFDSVVYFTDTLGGHLVKKVENVSANSALIEGLLERTSYYVYLAEAGNVKPGLVSVRKTVRTMCTPPAEIPVYGFEDDYYVYNTNYYFLNECWSYGTGNYILRVDNTTPANYLPRIMTNTTTIGYSHNGNAALKMETTTGDRRPSYIVMPYQNISDMDAYELVFDMRLAYHNPSNNKITAVYNTSTYIDNIIIGTVDDPEDAVATFAPIDTVYYQYSSADLTTSKLTTDDPNGDSWWQKCVVPLKSGYGKYIAFYQPGSTAKSATQYFDDMTIQTRQTAVAPTNLKAVTAATSVNLSWYAKQTGAGFRLQFSATNDFTTPLLDTVVNNVNPTITGLTPDSHYFWRVQQTGTPYGDSEFTPVHDFWTECIPVEGGLNTSFEFEDSENYRTTTTTLLKNKCWIYDNDGTTKTINASYYPSDMPSTSTVSYALTGTYGLKLYATGTTVLDYVVTPRIENIDMDSMQISLWMTPCPHGVSGTYLNQVSAAWAAANAAQVEIGTCTDPDDLSTYVALDTLKYNRYMVSELVVKAEATQANDFTFQKFIVPMAGAVGPYVFLRAIFDKKPNPGQTAATSQTTIYIDDFAVEPLQACATPQDLAAEDIKDVSTTLTWSAADDAQDYIIQVSTEYLFEDESQMVFEDTVPGTSTSVFVTGLSASSTYYARLKLRCVENGYGVWGQTIVFKTIKAPLYHDSFTESNQLAEGWTFATGLAKDVFVGRSFRVQSALPGHDNGWYYANKNEGLSGEHYAVRTRNSLTPRWWMITPTLMLNETDNAILSFKLNYIWYNTNWATDPFTYSIDSNKAGAAGLTGVDDQFMVIVSEDGGKTWTRENAIIWNNEASDDPSSENYYYGVGDYSLNGIRFTEGNVATDDMIRIDLSKYQGKAIRVAFYVESQKANTDNAIHIDDVHINYVTNLFEENNICQYEDYYSTFVNNDGTPLFEINGDNVEVGTIEIASYDMSVKPNANDTVRSLKLYVSEAPHVELPSDTICEGETFSGYDFKPISKSGLYKKKTVSQVTGCDSICSFYLYVTERVYANAEDTICRGQTYNFNGKMLNRSGLYVDTVTSFVTGCDSIINFMLFVREPEGVSEKVQICNGSTYQFGDTILSTSGIYTRTLTSVSGCDSVVTLDLTVLPELVDTIRDYFCPGSTYKQHGFDVSKAGVYRQSGTSVIGCDSLTVLVLEYYPTDTLRVEFTITTDELPYTYESLTYGVNTFPGTYVDTIAVSGEGCEVTVIHTLHVQLVEGVDNITGNTLTLAPNIISVGELINVVGKFSDKQMRDMNVDIFDMTGKRVATLRPQIQPIAIGGFYQAGIYNIRITAGDGTQYNGRVIVK